MGLSPSRKLVLSLIHRSVSSGASAKFLRNRGKVSQIFLLEGVMTDWPTEEPRTSYSELSAVKETMNTINQARKVSRNLRECSVFEPTHVGCHAGSPALGEVLPNCRLAVT